MAMLKTIDWTEEQLELRLNITAAAHNAAGFEEASKMLLKAASESFARDSDDEAHVLKEWSKKLAEVGERYRRTQREHQLEYDQRFPKD